MKANFLDWLYPPACALCSQPDSTGLCPACLAEFTPATPRPAAHPLLRIHALYAYSSRAGLAVRRLKYKRATALAAPMARLIAAAALESQPDLVVPVPIHWSRRFARGFNQSDLLCEAIPATLRPPTLLRIRRTKPQVKLTRQQRLTQLEGAFAAPTATLAGKRILLVDDVITTGGTANACATALLAAGAESVSLLCFCSAESIDQDQA